jgi:hypothetical protein
MAGKGDVWSRLLLSGVRDVIVAVGSCSYFVPFSPTESGR